MHNEQADGKVTKDEYIEYYSNVSSSIDTDEYFLVMMNNAWNLDGSRTVKGAVACGSAGGKANQMQQADIFGNSQRPSAKKQQKDIYKGRQDGFSDKELQLQMKTRLAKRGSRGIAALGRSFRIADDDNSHTLCRDEFKKCIHDFRIGLNEADTERLFVIFDADKNGSIDFDEFLLHVVGKMNEFRKAIALKAFKIMDKDGNGTIEVNDLRGVYNGKKHPDVIDGKKTEDEILFEFLDTFDMHNADE